MKKKGFTLIELLAVIVILAIIALIATPMIMGVIEKAKKGAAIQSVNGLLEAGEQYQLEGMLEGNSLNVIDLTSDTLSIKGSKPESGLLVMDSSGHMSIIAKYGKYCIEKKYEDEEPTIVEKNPCVMEEDEVDAKIYGVRRKINSSSTEWERIDNSVGLEANAIKSQSELETGVKNDFDNIYPWSDIYTYSWDKATGKETRWDETGFNYTDDYIFTKIPEFYYRRYQENGYEYVLISKRKIEGYTKSNEFSIGGYTMSGTEAGVYSKSGVKPLTAKTISAFRNYTKQLGQEFSQLDYHYFIIKLLYLVEYADYDSQQVLGKGNAFHSNDGIHHFVESGGCDELGMQSGTLENDGYHSMIYRGMEDIYGNIHQFVDGINIKDHQAYVCYDPNQYESDKFEGCYQKLGYMNATTSGWISKLGYDSQNPLIDFPTKMGGSDSTYIPDGYWQLSENRIALVGNAYCYTSSVGLWFWSLISDSSLASGSVGARLIKTS